MARDAGADPGHRPDPGHAATQRDVRGAPPRRARRRARRPGRRRGGAHGGPPDGPARAGAAAIGPAGGDRARVLRGAHADGDRRAAQAAARDGEDAHPARARAAARGRQAHDMNHESFDTLAAAYALGALDGEELVEFEAHLAQECARCAVTLRESYEALAALARSAPPAVPPPEVKQALLSRIAAVAPTASPRRERGRGPSPGATGWVIWHQTVGGQLFVANLPPPPPSKTYELWTIGEGAPRPAGVFRVDAEGRATHRVEPVEGGKPVKVFAVTLEPEGGVPAPTGPMVLASAK